MTRRYDYVTVGHVTCDVIEDRLGGAVSQPGGGAFYSALQASRLGMRTLIVTQGVPFEIEALLEPYREELDVHVIPAEHTTTLSTRGAGAARVQRVLTWAGPILAPINVDTSILHLAPVAMETPASPPARAGFLGITPQGLIRRWDENGEISHVPLGPGLLPARFDAAVIGDAERRHCAPLFAQARDREAVVAVTAGSRPTVVHLPDGTRVEVTPPSVGRPREDLGAGDVFAGAFFIALREGHAPQDAAAFGNAAAAVRVGGVGPSAIGRRSEIEAVPRTSARSG